jgi:membrane dipeptidase
MLLLFACGLSLGHTLPLRAPGPQTDYRKGHFEAVVADLHNDVVQRILGGENIGRRTASGHSDLPRFLEGGVDIQMFSIWVPPEKDSTKYFEQANEQIDSIVSFSRANPSRVELARSAEEAISALAGRKLVAMLGIEGGHVIGSDLEKLGHLARRGVRYMSLTWNNSTDWATSAYDESVRPEKLKHRGLTEFGRQVVRRMNELGILVDVSHVGETTFWDIIKVTKKPIMASHSSVWKICRHRRNLKDDQLKAIARTGGIVCINFLPNFIDSTFPRKERRLREMNKNRIDSLRSAWNGDNLSLDYAIVDMLKEEYRKIRPPLSVLVDHFDYAIKLIGADHVGIGSDFDGISTTPLDMDDVTFLPNLTRELLGRGYSVGEVKKVLGENFLRVLREASE